MDSSSSFKTENVDFCLENICKFIQNKKSFLKNKNDFNNIMNTFLSCDQSTETKNIENPFLYDVFAVIENGIKTPVNKGTSFSAIIYNIQALSRQTNNIKNLKIEVLRALICIFYIGSGDACTAPQRTCLQATELLSGKNLANQTAVDAVSYRIAHLFAADQKTASKGSRDNSFSTMLLNRLQQPSLSAPSTAVTILTTCTSYNVMLYLEDVLVQWLGLSRMNKEPNADWLLLREKFQMLGFYRPSTVNIVVSHLLSNFLAFSIHNETGTIEQSMLLVEWNNFEFMFGQHRLQTLVSGKKDNSNLTLVGGGGGGGKQRNDNIPCLHRYHHLALGADNDQVTFVPFNCVPEERFIVPLLECSIYRKLAAKISTDIGMVFDEAINKILTRGELPHFAANARKSFKQFVLSFYNYMNNFKDQIDKDYRKKTRNLSVFEEKHLLSYEMAYAKYRDALAYFDYFVMTYIFQHRYKLNQKLFPPACYHCTRHFNPLENLVSSAEIIYKNKYSTCDAKMLLRKIQKHSFYGATPVCLEVDDGRLSNKSLFQFGHVLDKKNLYKIFDRARTTFCSQKLIKSAAKELAILMQLQVLITTNASAVHADTDNQQLQNVYLALVFDQRLEKLCLDFFSLIRLEIVATKTELAKKTDTILPVPFKVAEAIFQAICYIGQGEPADYFNHVTSALTVLSYGAFKRRYQVKNNIIALLLARGVCIEKEPAFAFQTVLTTTNSTVANFCRIALSAFSTSTMTDQVTVDEGLQLKVLVDAITNADMKKLVSSLDVQYLVACNLTKLALLNWQQTLLQYQCLSSFLVEQSAALGTQGYLINPGCGQKSNSFLEAFPSNENYIKIKKVLSTKNTNFKVNDDLFTLTPVQSASQLQLTGNGILNFIEQIKNFFKLSKLYQLYIFYLKSFAANNINFIDLFLQQLTPDTFKDIGQVVCSFYTCLYFNTETIFAKNVQKIKFKPMIEATHRLKVEFDYMIINKIQNVLET